MGYKVFSGYKDTQADEFGTSLQAAGFNIVKCVPALCGWAESSVKRRAWIASSGS